MLLLKFLFNKIYNLFFWEPKTTIEVDESLYRCNNLNFSVLIKDYIKLTLLSKKLSYLPKKEKILLCVLPLESIFIGLAIDPDLLMNADDIHDTIFIESLVQEILNFFESNRSIEALYNYLIAQGYQITLPNLITSLANIANNMNLFPNLVYNHALAFSYLSEAVQLLLISTIDNVIPELAAKTPVSFFGNIVEKTGSFISNHWITIVAATTVICVSVYAYKTYIAKSVDEEIPIDISMSPASEETILYSIFEESSFLVLFLTIILIMLFLIVLRKFKIKKNKKKMIFNDLKSSVTGHIS